MRIVCLWTFFLAVASLPAQGFPLVPLESYRAELGLTMPSWDPGLANACSLRAKVLANTGVLIHSDDLGRGVGLQMVVQGGPPGEYGEILGAGADPQAVWKAWLASKPHREILSTPGWLHWGAGTARWGVTEIYVVRFWKP